MYRTKISYRQDQDHGHILYCPLTALTEAVSTELTNKKLSYRLETGRQQCISL